MTTCFRLAVAAAVTEIVAVWTLNWVLAIVGLGLAAGALWKLPDAIEEQINHD